MQKSKTVLAGLARFYNPNHKPPKNEFKITLKKKAMNSKIKSTAYIYFFVFTILFSLAVANETDAQRRGRGFSGAANEAVFEGIDDVTVLPLLRNLSRQYGGPNVPAEDGRLLYDLIIEKGYTRGLEVGTSNGFRVVDRPGIKTK